MAKSIKSFSMVSLSLFSNTILLYVFWAAVWSCTPRSFWTGIQNALLFIHVSPTPDNIVLALSLLTVIIPCFFYRTEPMQALAFWLMGARRPQGAALEKLNESMQLACNKAKLNAANYKLYVRYNEDSLNAWAFGQNRIMVTVPLLSSMDTKLIAGILAHELGHIRNGDTQVLSLTGCMSFFGELSVNILAGITRFLSFFCFVPILNLGIALVNLILFVSITLIKYLVLKPVDLIMLFFSRSNEFAADRYACKIGLGPELYQALSIITSGEDQQGIIEQLWSTHPVTKKRLARIQEFVENNQPSSGQDD